ncbi:hypothetical protein ANN_25930 [Periplaneta americana]|uniref:Uncharacterized protein n=1 Tax=Periplaneta americana TaxID=6978 RepID=A0ABQ8S4H5_PERAM|nr:hypothetical protein ANN_25930 [Periplaneta americana]
MSSVSAKRGSPYERLRSYVSRRITFLIGYFTMLYQLRRVTYIETTEFHINFEKENRVSVGASVFTITAMSIDRYLAIRHPMAFRKIFNRTTTLFVNRSQSEKNVEKECKLPLKVVNTQNLYWFLSCADIERSFSAYKVILSDTGRSFSFETLKMNVVVYCSRNRNQANNMQEK